MRLPRQLPGAAAVDHDRSVGRGDCSWESQQLSLVAASAMIHAALGEIANTHSQALSVTGDDVG